MKEPQAASDVGWAEIWRERPGDYFADSLHIHPERRALRFNCRGYVMTAPLEDLFALPASVPVDNPESAWHTAALLKDRTRRALRERVHAGESPADLAADYGVPVAFVEFLGEWQLFGDEKAQSWQPIESAPKDLTEVLVYDAEEQGIFLAQYEMHATPPYWSYDTHDLAMNSREQALHKVTHWMPLPGAPSIDRREP